MKEVTNDTRMIMSCVSCSVVKILAPVPNQFMALVIRESCPVALLRYVVIT